MEANSPIKKKHGSAILDDFESASPSSTIEKDNSTIQYTNRQKSDISASIQDISVTMDDGLANESDRISSSSTTGTNLPFEGSPAIKSTQKSNNSNTNNIAMDGETISDIEKKVRSELVEYLFNKNIEEKWSTEYKINIRKTKQSGNNGFRYGVSFTGPNGDILETRADVMRSILDAQKRTQLKRSSISMDCRMQASEEAFQQIQELSFPHTFDNVKVINLGVVVENPSFQNQVQIYPVGYKCEQTVTTTSLTRGMTKRHIVCEISDMDGNPEFRITNLANGDTYLAQTESDVWRKLLGSVAGEVTPDLSFFNLDIELLIEGLKGAVDCETYKFHVERGYGDTYHSQAQNIQFKMNHLSKSGRDRRNQDRQKSKFMTQEEIKQQMELSKQQEEANKELKKKLAFLEKQKKDEEKELMKRKREQQKILESVKQTEHKAKQSMSKEEREQKAKQEKLRQQSRRELLLEIKKRRVDAQSSVVHYFDEEEQTEEDLIGLNNALLIANNLSTVDGALENKSAVTMTISPMMDKTLQGMLQSLPTSDPCIKNSNKEQHNSSIGWEDIINLASTLHLLKTPLNLDSSVELHHLLNTFETVCEVNNKTFANFSYSDPVKEQKNLEQKAPPQFQLLQPLQPSSQPLIMTLSTILNPTTSSASSSNIMQDSVGHVESKSPEKVNVLGNLESSAENFDKIMATEKPHEVDIKTSGIDSGEKQIENSSQLNAASVEVDRIQLKLAKLIISELNILFESAEEKEPDPNVRKKNLSDMLPVNQLTWHELVRMSIIAYLYTEIGRTKDETIAAIRGTKQQGLKSSKGIAKMIRYKLYLKERQFQESSNKSNILPFCEVKFDSSVDEIDKTINPLICDISDNLNLIPRLVQKYYSLSTSDMSSNNVSSENISVGNQSIIIPFESTINSVLIEKQKTDWSNDSMIVDSIEDPIIWTSEAELNNSLHNLSLDETYPDVYKRCSKVLIKIINSNNAKELIWDVSSELYPDYFLIIKAPLSFSSIARKLIKRTYDEFDLNISQDLIGLLFYQDMKQVLLNCFTFNSESSLIVGHTQKLAYVIHRHVSCWIQGLHLYDDLTIPTIEECDDRHCLLSHLEIHQNGVKCGKCNGYFSFDFILTLAATSANPYCLYALEPKLVGTSNSADDWVCPLCLKEDCTIVTSFFGSPFSIDQWGQTAGIPWIFNDQHSWFVRDIVSSYPHLEPVIQALFVLANVNPHQIFPSRVNKNDQFLLKNVTEDSLLAWDVSQRLGVLVGLCTLTKSNIVCVDYINKIRTDCEKLIKICERDAYREADVISIVRTICGDNGVDLCRSLLDGSDSKSSFSHIMEGRCILCNGSTYEEDLRNQAIVEGNEESEEKVILCDGCQAEVHLKCLSLSVVPSSDWFCDSCKERQLLRQSTSTSKSDRKFDSYEKERLKEEEDELVDESLEKMVDESGENVEFVLSEPNEVKCVYCDMGEHEICSPFVIGQSRSEHNATVNLTEGAKANFFYPEKTNTKVRFLLDGFILPAPTIEFPFFPVVTSNLGIKLLETYEKLGINPTVCHQMCSLQLFQLRIYRE
eukprot:gene12853-17228_t